MNNKFVVVAIAICSIIVAGAYFWIAHHRADSKPAVKNAVSDCIDTGVTGGGGTIVAISGNQIITNDAYSSQTTTIIIGPATGYYEADLNTPVASASLLVIGQSIIAGGIGCHWKNGFPTTIDATRAPVSRLPILSDIAAPAGWYAHRVELGAIVFTKQAQLSIPSATEGFALGEQIDTGAYRLDHPPKDWAWANIGTASGTMGAPPASDWGKLNGYQTLRAPIGIGEEPELIYAIFDPARYTVYEFSLYPYPNATDTSIFDALVQDFAKNVLP